MQTTQERIIAGFEQSRTLHEGDLIVARMLTNYEWRNVLDNAGLYLDDSAADVIEAALDLYIAKHEAAIKDLNAAIANYKAAKS